MTNWATHSLRKPVKIFHRITRMGGAPFEHRDVIHNFLRQQKARNMLEQKYYLRFRRPEI